MTLEATFHVLQRTIFAWHHCKVPMNKNDWSWPALAMNMKILWTNIQPTLKLTKNCLFSDGFLWWEIVLNVVMFTAKRDKEPLNGGVIYFMLSTHFWFILLRWIFLWILLGIENLTHPQFLRVWSVKHSKSQFRWVYSLKYFNVPIFGRWYWNKWEAFFLYMFNPFTKCKYMSLIPSFGK